MFPSENIPKTKCSDPSIAFQRQALKTKSYIFSKTYSMKLERQTKKPPNQNKQDRVYEKLFVPKLKSKQLLREPKFFFSLQRKKIKNNEQSEPSFEEPRAYNPEMKGSKAKALYTKIMMSRKESVQECLKVEKGAIYRNKSFNERQSTSESQCEKVAQIFANQKIQGQLQKYFPNQTTLQVKVMKRPNLYENISFLIRRKREIKNRSTMKKINQSKHYMTEEVIKTEEEVK